MTREYEDNPPFRAAPRRPPYWKIISFVVRATKLLHITHDSGVSSALKRHALKGLNVESLGVCSMWNSQRARTDFPFKSSCKKSLPS